MFHILHPADHREGAIAAVEFEGKHYAAGVSFFRGDVAPGIGPGLHKHPYPETCIVRSGRVAVTLDGEDVVAGAGDIVVVGPETPHRFTAIGDERLEMVCIHASDHFIIEWLGGRREAASALSKGARRGGPAAGASAGVDLPGFGGEAFTL